MRDCDDAAFVSLQCLLQSLLGIGVEVICWFVEKQEIIFSEQEFEHRDSRSLASTQSAEFRLDHLAGELETAEQGADIPVIHARFEGANLLDWRQFEIQRAVILMEVADLHSGSDINDSGVEFEFTVDEAQ